MSSCQEVFFLAARMQPQHMLIALPLEQNSTTTAIHFYYREQLRLNRTANDNIGETTLLRENLSCGRQRLKSLKRLTRLLLLLYSRSLSARLPQLDDNDGLVQLLMKSIRHGK